MRTLLTGFGPFGSTVNNPSARIVEHFTRTGTPGHALTIRVLPVSFARAAKEVQDLLSTGQFDAAVLLGVAGREENIRLERVGRLRTTGRIDIDGSVPCHSGRPPDAAERYGATLSLEPLRDELMSAGLPARLSDDAGDYVCNHTYYTALETIAAGGLITRCLFIHVPPDAATFREPVDGPTLPLERQIDAVALVLDWLARQEPCRSMDTRTAEGKA